jgi:ribosome-associated translation inhibitor RaiA
MQVDIKSTNVTISEALQLELHRALMAELGQYLEHIEGVSLRLGASEGSARRRHAHCRASAQLVGGKTVWVDRSHARLDDAALTAIEQLNRVVGIQLARGTAEFPALVETERPAAGKGWVLLEMLG